VGHGVPGDLAVATGGCLRSIEHRVNLHRNAWMSGLRAHPDVAAAHGYAA
jgi:hypothetical protein